jgi:preprotein translocase subunit YajC
MIYIYIYIYLYLSINVISPRRSAASKQVASSSTSELSTGDEVISLNGLLGGPGDPHGGTL